VEGASATAGTSGQGSSLDCGIGLDAPFFPSAQRVGSDDDLDPAQLDAQLSEMYTEVMETSFGGDNQEHPPEEGLLLLPSCDGIDLGSDIFRDLDAEFAVISSPAEIIGKSNEVRAPTSHLFSAEDIVARIRR
jgi:hypothetical protein